MTDSSETAITHEVDVDAVIEQLNNEQNAFEMFIAGYRLRVKHEQEEPSSLRDKNRFGKALRDNFRRAYND